MKESLNKLTEKKLDYMLTYNGDNIDRLESDFKIKYFQIATRIVRTLRNQLATCSATCWQNSKFDLFYADFFLVSGKQYRACDFAFSMYECLTEGLGDESKLFWKFYDDTNEVYGK